MMHTNNESAATRMGFYISLVTAITTLITFWIAFNTPPLSGPFCTANCFEYPYTDIITRFPRDYYWMYPTMFISILFICLMLHVHYLADSGKKFFSHLGLIFSVISASLLIPNYFVQVSVIQPSLLNGETEGIALFTQFNPHGVFIALEEIGFLMMNLAFFVIIPVFTGKKGLYRVMRLTWLIGFILALVALILISITLGMEREYMFEVTIISIVWIQLILSSFLLSAVFKRKMKKNK